MALVLVYYKTIQIYFCSCGEQVPEYHKFIQDDTASRPNYKDVDYECTSCAEIVRIELEFISSSGYIPPTPPVYDYGDAYGWGSNVSGCVGDNTIIQRDDPVQVHGLLDVGFLENIKIIRGGGFNAINIHTLAIDKDDKVYAWGEGSSGQLGDNASIDRHVPIRVLGVGGVGFIAAIEVGAGGQHSLFLDENGFVYACGGDVKGQCGDGAVGGANPALVQVVDNPGTGLLTDVVDIDAGWEHSIACDSNGHVWCWGESSKGQLGIGPTGDHPTPQQVLGVGGVGVLENIIKVAANFESSYALASDGTVYAWGDNTFDQLGNNNTGVHQNTPVKVHGLGDVGDLTNVVEIDTEAGSMHVLALLNDDTVVAWGYNASGQCGDGVMGNNPFPDYVVDNSGLAPITDIVEIAAGGSHSVLCDKNKDMWAFGRTLEGQLGQGTPPPANQNKPVQVHGVGDVGFLVDVIKVGAGYTSSFAVII